MTQIETYLTIKEACEILKISRATFNRWMKESKIPFSKVGRIVRIKKSDIEKVMN